MTLNGFLAALALSFAPQIAAAFGNCEAPGYLAAFGEVGGAEPCTLHHEETLSVNGHAFTYRVISLSSVPSGDDADWVAGVRAMMERLAETAQSLGPTVRVPDLTILMTDRTAVDGDGFEIHGERTRVRIPGECPIAFYKVADEVLTWEYLFTFAHEVFHCIQDTSWPAGSAGSVADWWAEGSAEYFAQMVMPQAAPLSEDFRIYGEKQQDSPPYEEGRDYDNVVLFDGIHANSGAAGTGAFMAAMPAGGGYLGAMQAQFSLDQWAAFTEAYLDGRLREPGLPRTILAPRVPIEHIAEEEERSIELSTDAFEQFRIDIEFPAGARYEISVEGSPDLRARIDMGDDLWTDMPVQIMACGDAVRSTIYAVTTTGPQEFTINYRRLDECGDCQEVRTQDACLIGRWTMTGGGPIEYMRAMGIPEDMISMQASEISLRFVRGGDYVVNPIDVEVEGNSDGMVIEGTGTNRDSGGRWSTADGQLNICPLTGETIATTSTEAQSNTMIFGPGENISLGYTCAGDTLETLIDVPGMPPMPSTYTRQ